MKSFNVRLTNNFTVQAIKQEIMNATKWNNVKLSNVLNNVINKMNSKEVYAKNKELEMMEALTSNNKNKLIEIMNNEKQYNLNNEENALKNTLNKCGIYDSQIKKGWGTNKLYNNS